MEPTPAPGTTTLSYVATVFGVLIGFTIVFFLGEFRDARQAAVDEATAVRTVSEEARLFPQSGTDIQHALICYSRAVSEREWPELADGESAPEVDRAYADIVRVLTGAAEPAGGPFQRAAATNLVVQVGASPGLETPASSPPRPAWRPCSGECSSAAACW